MTYLKCALLAFLTFGFTYTSSTASEDESKSADSFDYVQVCDTFGDSYFLIPGTDICLEVEGDIRARFEFEQENDEEDPELKFDARGRIALDARLETIFGLSRSYVRMSADDDGEAELSRAYVQLGGLTLGYDSSFGGINKGDYALSSNHGYFFSGETVPMLGYELDLSDLETTISFGVEKPTGHSKFVPDFAAALDIDLDWLEINIGGGAISQVYEKGEYSLGDAEDYYDEYVYDEDEYDAIYDEVYDEVYEDVYEEEYEDILDYLTEDEDDGGDWDVNTRAAQYFAHLEAHEKADDEADDEADDARDDAEDEAEMEWFDSLDPPADLSTFGFYAGGGIEIEIPGIDDLEIGGNGFFASAAVSKIGIPEVKIPDRIPGCIEENCTNDNEINGRPLIDGNPVTREVYKADDFDLSELDMIELFDDDVQLIPIEDAEDEDRFKRELESIAGFTAMGGLEYSVTSEIEFGVNGGYFSASQGDWTVNGITVASSIEYSPAAVEDLSFILGGDFYTASYSSADEAIQAEIDEDGNNSIDPAYSVTFQVSRYF